MKTEQSTEVMSIYKKILLGVMLACAGITFFFAQSVLWVNHTVFNQKAFVEITTNVLMTQESRDAIAKSIVDKSLQNKPVANRLLGDRAVTFVSGLLGSDISEKVLERSSGAVYGYVTSPNRQDIAIDLSAIKQPLAAIVSFSESRGRTVNFDPTAIPDNITLVESDELPKVNEYIQKLMVLGALLWISTIALFSAYIFSSKRERIRRFYYSALTIAGVAILSIFAGPFVPSAISSYVSNIQFRGIASDLTAAYLHPFIKQMYLTLILTALVALLVRFRWIFPSIWQSLQAAADKRKSTPEVAKKPKKAKKSKR